MTFVVKSAVAAVRAGGATRKLEMSLWGEAFRSNRETAGCIVATSSPEPTETELQALQMGRVVMPRARGATPKAFCGAADGQKR
jgi:hypothetical protein